MKKVLFKSFGNVGDHIFFYLTVLKGKTFSNILDDFFHLKIEKGEKKVLQLF
jgi:hypothetical protein